MCGFTVGAEQHSEGARMADRVHYRAVFISDVHLGSSGCRATELAAFLKHVDCDTLYLVGDIIDMWRLRQRWYWPSKHNRVISRILKKARHGGRVVYIPGNHDEHARQYAGLKFGDVEVRREAVHITADGRKLLVTHGDQFDLIVKHHRVISMLGARAYDALVMVNNRVNWVRRRLGLQYWSLSQSVKLKVKGACTFIAQFEHELIAEAKRAGMDGVVCGHIHKAEIRTDAPVAYYNCGDWVEGTTALVEHEDGSMEIVDGAALVDRVYEQRRRSRDTQDSQAPRYVSQTIAERELVAI